MHHRPLAIAQSPDLREQQDSAADDELTRTNRKSAGAFLGDGQHGQPVEWDGGVMVEALTSSRSP